MATKLAAKPNNGDEDRVTQASIPVMPEPQLPEASVSTLSYSDSEDEDVDEVPLVDSPPQLPHPSGSHAHPSSLPLSTPLLEQTPPSRCNSNNRCSIPSLSTDVLHNPVDTPPPPPPLNQRRPQPDDDMVVLPTPDSEPKTSRTYTDIVKHYLSGKNHHQQPQDHKLKSIIIDPAHREVPPRRAGLRVRFADSPSCSTTSGIDSSRNTLWRKIDYPQDELHHSPTHPSSNDGSMTRLSPRIRKIIEGRCFICLARGHWAVACRDPITCFRCRRSGHRERDCHQRQAMPCRPPRPQRLPREEHSSGHQNDCRTERLHLRSDDPAAQHFFTEYANYFQHEIKKLFDKEVQSLHSEFSLLLSAQLQKLQDSNEKWMKLAENLMLQIHAVSEKLKIASTLNQDWSSVNPATIAAVATSPSQEPRGWGDQIHRPKEIAPSGSPVKVVTTSNKINSSSSFNRSAIPEVTIQDVEDALLQIEIVAAKEPPLNSVSCCSPAHAASGESDPLLLFHASTNVEPFCPVIQLEKQTTGSSAQMLRLETVESTTPTLEVNASSCVLTSHQIEDTPAKATLEGTTGFRLRRCRFRPGCVYTRRPRCESARPCRGFGAASSADPCMGIVGQGHISPPLPEDGGQTAREVVLANFIQSITKPIQQPLLPPQHGLVKPRKEKNRPSKPSRHSARLAAIAWPCGDAQSKARQVLMKRLGITQEEGETMEMTLLRYLNLFKGPMSDLVIKALVALSGLDGPAMLGQIAT